MKTIEYLKDNGVDVDTGLSLLGDEETYNSMLKDFSINLPSKLEDIASCYEKSDMTNYSIYTHSLKSDSKYFGFTKLAELALNHEKESGANNMLFVRNNYNALISEANNIKNLITNYFSDTDDVDMNKELEILDDNLTQPESLYKEDIILVADDSELIRAFVKKLFDIPYALEFASDGEEAIEIIDKHKDDNLIGAILLDLNMPRKSGFEVLDHIKELGLESKMPVTIVSGEQSKELIDRVFNYNIVDMINKPFSEAKIKDAIEKTIASKK